jgi:hypothetical protein
MMEELWHILSHDGPVSEAGEAQKLLWPVVGAVER